MKRLKRKLIIEVIIDIIFICFLISGTIYGILYVFPEVRNADVVTIEKYECDNSYDCVCDGNECRCKYCLNNNCNEYKEIICER